MVERSPHNKHLQRAIDSYHRRLQVEQNRLNIVINDGFQDQTQSIQTKTRENN